MTYICMSDHTLSGFIKTGHLPVFGVQSGERGPQGGVFLAVEGWTATED